MALFFEQKDRNVVPNWRSFENTTKLKEVNGLKKSDLSNSFVPDLSIINKEWEDGKNIGIAAELINIGTTFGINNNIIEEAVRFILSNQQKASQALIDSANLIVLPKNLQTPSLEISSIERFTDLDNLQLLYRRIHDLKVKIMNNARNPIHWIDIARYYSMIGQNKKAKIAILNGLNLAKDNRFILRSVARFFIHNNDWEFAHDILRKKEITRFDPWLAAAEISLASMRGRNSRFIKNGVSLVQSKNLSPFDLSELSSALGTLEMQNGNHKKSRSFFNISLIDPNDNALAQAEWASQKDNIINLTGSSINSNLNSFEALALEFYEKGDWQMAMENSVKWFLDLPFSKSPILFATHISRTFLKDHKKAIELGKVGLISHPNDPILINNLIYSLCIEDQLNEAQIFLAKSELVNKSEREKTIFNATKGLYFFRTGQYELGRYFYNLAINDAKGAGDKILNKLALVNYTREEVLINSEYSKSLISQLDIITKGETDDSILSTKEEILSIIRKRLIDNLR